MKQARRILAILIVLCFAFTSVAFAAIPTHTIIFDDKAFDAQLLANAEYSQEINDAFKAAGGTFIYKAPSGIFYTPALDEVPAAEIPAVTYKNADGEETRYAAGDGDVISDELKVISVSAINSKQAEVKFNKEVKEVKPANFKVTDIDGNLLFVSKAELNEEKTVATLSFFDAFADKGVYTVEVSNVADVDGNVMEKATAQFGYEKAEVAKVEFTATTVAPETELKKVVKVTDALGRDVTEEVKIEFESSNNDVVSADDGKAKEAGSAIVVAKVKVGDSYVKSAPTTIKVEKEMAATFVGFNVYAGKNPAGTTEDFEKLEADKKADYVYVTDKDSDGKGTKKLSLYYKDQYGKSMKAVPETDNETDNESNELNVTNLTPAVVIVEKDGTITPISAGEGYVKVKANDKLEHTIKIVVREEPKVTTMELDKTDVSVVAGSAVGQEIKVTFKDQFGNKDTVAKAKAVSKDTTIAIVTPAEGTTFTIKGVKEGTTTVEVTYKNEANKVDLKETINVTVTKAADLATYKVEVESTELDLANTGNTNEKKAPISVDVAVFEVDANGNKIGTVEFGENKAQLVLVDKDGKELAANAEKVVGLATGSLNTIEAIKVGTGYVQVKVGSLVVDTIEFTVINTAPTPTAAEVDSLTLYKEISEVLEGKLDDVLKGNLTFRDQYGEKKTVNGNEITVVYVLTNADGVSVSDDGKITGIKKDKALVDVVLTEVKIGDTDGKNLLAKPVVIKLQVYVEFKEITPVPDGNYYENEGRERYYAKYTFNDSDGVEVDVSDYDWAKQIKPDGSVYYLTASGDNAIWFPVSDTKYGFRQVEGTHTFYLIKENKGYTFTIDYEDPTPLPGTQAEEEVEEPEV